MEPSKEAIEAAYDAYGPTAYYPADMPSLARAITTAYAIDFAASQREVDQARAEAEAADKLSVERQSDVDREWKRANEAQREVERLKDENVTLKKNIEAEIKHSQSLEGRG